MPSLLSSGRFIYSPLGSENHFAHSSSSFVRQRREGLHSSLRAGVVARRRKAMSSSNVVENGTDVRVRSSKMSENVFMGSLMPKEEIGALKFLESHPSYDGRGVVIAILDSGIDPAAAGLQVTTDGKPKIIDIVDCTGSGDMDTSKIVKADIDGFLTGASGRRLQVNSEWKNPSGEWRVGYKFIYELFTESLTARLKKERKKKWQEEHVKAFLQASKDLALFDEKYPMSTGNEALKREREELQNKVDFLRKQEERYEDKGPIIDVVVWNDGLVWRAAVDTQELEEDPETGKLQNFVPLTNFRLEQKYGVFSRLDACSFAVNIYDNGNILSMVTDCSPHGTHVAGITAAYHPEEPSLNGIAPGAQLVSCKIGDTRLGSMETGTGLTRALIAVIENKCDMINMSYGEPTMLPDYGRFIKLINEIVNKHRVIFVSSAGNNGPALSTVTAPGGTSSNIIGVGAYVSPAMASAAYCLVEPLLEGLEYTWSSRGPTTDGDLGVCLSAPGGAVAPVPTWTLQRRMLMNGTSMASPCACGGIALLLSSMKAEGSTISPYIVRKALENTATQIGDKAEEKLSTGHGLLQVEKAYDYLEKCSNVPTVWYQVKTAQSGGSGDLTRGIYLREASDCKQTSEWTVQVQPKFHEGVDNLTVLVPFEECIELKSSNSEIVRVPEYLLLTHNGRSFNILVDPTSLSEGLHFYEVSGVDCNAPWRGPLFRIPITIIKPFLLNTNQPVTLFAGVSFLAGHIERKFIEVPFGASWVEATIKASGFDTPRRFFINCLQVCPKSRPLKWESVVTFSSPSLTPFSFSVEGGQTMEITIAQFWSSGNGSHAKTIIDLEVEFHGLIPDKKDVLLPCTDAFTKIDIKAPLSSERLCPSGYLSKIRIPHRPVESSLAPLPSNRDTLPSQAQIYGMTLIYKFTMSESASVTPCLPLLNNRIYDTEFESQFYMIANGNKRIFATGDVYPGAVKLMKGDYVLRLLLRHDNIQYLKQLENLVLFIDVELEAKNYIKLDFYSQPDGPITGEGSFKSSILLSGETQAFYIASPSEDKLPKNACAGSVMLGKIHYGRLSFSNSQKSENRETCPSSYDITYIVPPAKVELKDNGKAGLAKKRILKNSWEEEVRDEKIKILGNLPMDSPEDCEEWRELAISLKSEYPNHTPLLARILEVVAKMDIKNDPIKHHSEVIKAADDVILSINKEELAKYFGIKHKPDEEDVKKHMEELRDYLADAFYKKGLALTELESLMPGEADEKKNEILGDSQNDRFEENYEELCKWADVTSRKYGLLSVQRERRLKRLGSALKVIDHLIQDDSKAPEKKLFDVRMSIIEETGWEYLASYERDWLLVRFPEKYPLF